jgi:uncharacterized membrane protein (DUF373 family)
MRERLYRVLDRLEAAIYLFAGLLLALAAGLILVFATVEGVADFVRGDYPTGVIHLLDRVLLALMLAEVIYTVVRFAREGTIEAEPFLIIGIIASVRRLLVLTAEGVAEVSLSSPRFLALLAELGSLAVAVLLFAWAIYLIRRSRSA